MGASFGASINRLNMTDSLRLYETRVKPDWIESFLPEVQARFADILEEQKDLPIPEQAGQGIALKQR